MATMTLQELEKWESGLPLFQRLTPTMKENLLQDLADKGHSIIVAFGESMEITP